MKKGCLFSLILMGVLGYAYYFVLHIRYEPPGDWIGAIIGTLGTLMGIGLIRNSFQAKKDLRAIQNALSRVPPQDGKVIAAIGPVHPSRSPLQAPFTGRNCVAYSYEVFRMVTTRSTSSDNTTSTSTSKVMDRSGFALAPCEVRTSTTRIKLLGFPFMEGFEKRSPASTDDRERARKYLTETAFEDLSGLKLVKTFSQMKDVFTDDDGSIRKDWRMTNTDIDELLNNTITEEIIGVGEEVCALGLYSSQKGGIVPDFGGKGVVNRVIKGNAKAVQARLKSSVVKNLIGGVILLAVVNAALYFVLTMRQQRDSDTARKAFQRIQTAVEEGNETEIYKLLTIGGFDPNIRDSSGRTPLMFAKTPDTAKFLISNGADVNARTDEGQTVLMEAVNKHNHEIVKTLIEAHVDLEAVSGTYKTTALTQAVQYEDTESAALLRAAGAKGDSPKKDDNLELPSDGGAPFAACKEYLAAVQSSDLSKLKTLVTGWKDSEFEGIDFAKWKGVRPSSPNFVQGFIKGDTAVVMLSGTTSEGIDTTWIYKLKLIDGKWLVISEKWKTK